MLKLTNSSKVKVLIESLLFCGNDFRSMKQSVESLYDLFKSITGISIDNLNEGDIHLPSGKAISPSGAAHCLLELKRTAIFLRGIKQAIDFKLSNTGNLVRILYAGCGPYATLLVPLLYYYRAHNIRITLLDVNEVSLNAAKKVVEALGFNEYIEHFELADATTYKVDTPYDLVISETMQSGLKNEPQVAIMQNLIPQCKTDVIFIPEQITIDVYIKKRGIWDGNKLLEEGGETKHIGQLFYVSKENLNTINYRKVINLPETFNKPHDVLLYTTIKVFRNEVLGLNDCSLNMPLKYHEMRGSSNNSMEFWYSQSGKPKIESKVLDYIV